jgi:hypothetical protein
LDKAENIGKDGPPALAGSEKRVKLKEPLNKSALRSSIPSGDKARVDFAAFAARLKSCPVTKQPYAEFS